MTISGNVPQHLVVGARTGFLSALESKQTSDYLRIAEVIKLNAKSTNLVSLGASPYPVESTGQLQHQDFIEKFKLLEAKDWEITVDISQNAIDDDQTGNLDREVRGAGEGFKQFINDEAFKALNDGDATTNYGAAYDGLAFYSASHVDNGADYQTAQDNVSALALSIDNFETVKVASRKFKNDRGKPVGFKYDLLVVADELERTAAQICNNAEAYDTGNREMNPYAGVTKYITSPQFDSTAWALVASGESTKPILIGMRQEPFLQSAWFNPEGPGGGIYSFKFFARFIVAYGDWRLAHLGNS